jgi:hypothetical protein
MGSGENCSLSCILSVLLTRRDGQDGIVISVGMQDGLRFRRESCALQWVLASRWYEPVKKLLALTCRPAISVC